jgi:hypothetical protein
MPPVEREMWQNIWTTSLPQEINFIGQVFPSAAIDVRHALMKRVLESMRETSQNAAPSATQDDAQTAAMRELERRYQFGDALHRWWQKY